MKLLIRNGYVIDPAGNREGYYDVLTDGERIARVAEGIEEAEAERWLSG